MNNKKIEKMEARINEMLRINNIDELLETQDFIFDYMNTIADVHEDVRTPMHYLHKTIVAFLEYLKDDPYLTKTSRKCDSETQK